MPGGKGIVLDSLLPLYINYQVYQMILEARASEHSARMVAMKAATDNAEQMIKDLTLEYNERRERCEEAARDLKVKALRDVTPQQLEAGKPTLDIMAYRRAKHVVGECDRVNRAAEALADEDLPTFGQILFESHASSIDNFENSCSELDILVEASRSLPGCYGARLSGGGFGGISIHLVEKAQADLFQQRLAEAFKSRTGRELQTMICQVGQGAEIDV